MRAVCDLSALGERQITIDCDVLQADGGTRTAAITGGFVALAQCVAFMKKTGMVTVPVIKDHVAAVSAAASSRAKRCSIWITTKTSTAETDANFVLTGAGGLVEIQGTAEGAPFSEEQLVALLTWRARASANWWICRSRCLFDEDVGMRLPRGSQLVVASHNPGKVREIKALLGPHGIEPISAGGLGLPEPEETGLTFAANAESRRRLRPRPAAMPRWPMIPDCAWTRWMARRASIRRAGRDRPRISASP